MEQNVVFFRVEATGVGDLVDQLGLLRREAKQLQGDLNKAADPAEYLKLNRALEQNRSNQKEITAAIREQNKTQKETATAAEGSYVALNAELVKLRKAFKQLSAEERESKVGATAIEQIQALDQQLKDLDASIGQYQRNVGNYQSAFDGFAGTLLQIGAVADIAQFFDPNALIEQGLAIQGLDNKARTVFGETLPKVTAEAEKNAAALGLSSRQYINQAAAIQDLLVPMGFTRDRASEISTQLQNVSGALSEWTGGTRSSAEVSEILSSALLGERDALKSLGISISEADITSRLAAQGQDKLTGAALEQAKAQATLDLVLAKSTDAQAAFAAGADNPIRQLNLLKAQATELAEQVASGVTPALAGLIKLFLALADFVENNKVAFGAAALAVGTYTVAVNASTIATAAAEFAQLALNTAIKAAPYVAVAAAVFALAKVITDYVTAADAASVATETISQSSERLSSAVSSNAAELARETNDIRSNFQVLKDATAARDDKRKAIAELKKEYPDLIRQYDLEKGSLQDIEKAEKSILAVRAQKLAQKITEQEIETLTKELLQANQDLKKAEEEALVAAQKRDAALAGTESAVVKIGKGVVGYVTGGLSNLVETGIDLNTQRLADNAIKQVELIKARIEATKQQIGTVGSSVTDITGQLVEALAGVPVTAADAGDATATALDKGVTKGAKEPIKTLKSLREELVKTKAELDKYTDTELIPINLVEQAKRLEDEIARLEKELAKPKEPIKIEIQPIIVKPEILQAQFAKISQDLTAQARQLEADRIKVQQEEFAKNQPLILAAAQKRQEEQFAAEKEQKDAQQKALTADLQARALDLAQQGADALFKLEEENAARRLESQLEGLARQEEDQLALVEGNAIAEQQVREDFAAQREQIEREAFEKGKQRQIAQAVINAALAVTNALATTQPLVPAGIIAAAAVAASTAVQIATIAAQQFARGGLIEGEMTPKAEHGIFVGPSHAGGGINTRLSGRRVNVEGGEYFERLRNGSTVVINKRSTSRFRDALLGQAGRDYPGKLQTLSGINQYGGGVPLFAMGGLVPTMGNASVDPNQNVQLQLLAASIDKLSNRVPVLTVQSYDTVNARANQVKTLQGL
jgi:hypothetical protein